MFPRLHQNAAKKRLAAGTLASPLNATSRQPQPRKVSSLSSTLDLSRLPTPENVLPRADPWIPSALTGRHLRVPTDPARLAAAVTRGDADAAWTIFCGLPPLRTKERRAAVTALRVPLVRLLELFSTSRSDPRRPLARAQIVKAALDDAAPPSAVWVGPGGYAALINLAMRAGNPGNVIEKLWEDMTTRRVPRNTNVWNHYIAGTCDAFPSLWPHAGSNSAAGSPGSSSSVTGSVLASGATTNSAEAMVDLMSRVEGIPIDSRTCDLLVLAVSRQRQLQTAREYVARMWLSPKVNDIVLRPTLASLAAVVESWAFNGAVAEGVDVAKFLAERFNLPLAAKDAEHFWTRALRLVLVATQPRGDVDNEVFHALWDSLHAIRSPPAGAWSIRVEFLEWKNQFDAMVEAVPEIQRLGPVGERVARSTLARAVVGLANTGRALDAASLLQLWSSRGLDLRPELEDVIGKLGGSAERAAIYEEDDEDGESLLGY